MDEHVLIAGHRLDEPITLGRVEPLDGAFLHRLSPGLDVKKTRSRDLRATPQAGCLKVCSIFLVAKRTVERPGLRLCPRLQHEKRTLASLGRYRRSTGLHHAPG